MIRAHAASVIPVGPGWNSYRIASRYGRPRQWFGFALIVRETPGTEAPRAKRPLDFAGAVVLAYATGSVTHFPRKSPPPRVKVKTAVVTSGAETEKPVTMPALEYRWYDATTASAVRAEASANFAFARRWNVTELAVRFTSQLVASHGSGTSVDADGTARESYTREWRTPFSGLTFSGSESRTAVVATTSVSP